MAEALQTRCGRKLLIYIVDSLCVHGKRWLGISLKAESHEKEWYMARVLWKPSDSMLTGNDERC